MRKAWAQGLLLSKRLVRLENIWLTDFLVRFCLFYFCHIVLHTYGVISQYMYTVWNHQIRVISISIVSNVDHFYVVGTFQILL